MIDQKSMVDFHNSVVEFANSMSDEQLMGWEKAFRESRGKPLVSDSFKRSTRSGVVAKPDSIHERWLSGEIASLEAIDELVESGMDFKEADKLVTTWIHNV
jgi:hypothetical protein